MRNRTKHAYARTPAEGKAFRAALKAYLVCPTCGVTPQGIFDAKKSMSAVVMKCAACGLRYHCKREDLARSARKRADECEDPKEAQLLDRLAALFEPHTPLRHQFDATMYDESDGPRDVHELMDDLDDLRAELAEMREQA